MIKFKHCENSIPMRKVSTLCLIYDRPKNRVLLGMKKRGFGAGNWNGFGGKLEKGEMLLASAKREISEESGIVVEESDIIEVGNLDFQFEGKLDEILEVHIFRIETWKGEPQESEEMKPQWFPASAIPFTEMWPDDKHWFPLFLAGKKFKGRFLFGKDTSILEQSLTEV